MRRYDNLMQRRFVERVSQGQEKMVRTSSSHPLQIATIELASGGAIGVTFCPGKKDDGALTGSWDRDLDQDIEAIARWGAQDVVTLLEAHEFDLLGVSDLGASVVAKGMKWHHAPIKDVSTPGAMFDAIWQAEGASLRKRLREGGRIVVHCRGGLGRAGTIAALLLVELGVCAADDAIRIVRKVRPGAIQTVTQERYVRTRAIVDD